MVTPLMWYLFSRKPPPPFTKQAALKSAHCQTVDVGGFVSMMLAQAARAGVRRHLARTQLMSRPFAKVAEHIVDTSFPEKDLEIKKQKTVKARSLSLDPSSWFRVEEPALSELRNIELTRLGFYRKPSRLIRGANNLFSRISSQVHQPERYTNFALNYQSNTLHAMLNLYMWLSICRLRSEGKDGGAMCRFLYDAFNRDFEGQIIAVGLKECVSIFMDGFKKDLYDAVAAYDKAMRPEAVKDELAWALWRNVFGEDDSIMPTGPNSTPVHALARHVRREAACLALTDSESFKTGNILFSNDFGAVTDE